MFNRRSDDTTRTTSTGRTSVTSPTTTSTMSGGPGTTKRKGGFFRRLHPDHTNQALETKVNSPAVTGAEARQAQRELKDRGVTPPKRGMGARIARLRMKWHSNGRATSKTAAQPY